MGTNQQFNLRWNNHTNNILQVFLEQFSSETLVDVTLSCQGQFLRAHKMVLSACSPYFQDLFQVHQVQHPVIIMNGMKFNDIKQIVEFMYKGEIKVLEAELGGLLAAAETLQVKGLSHVRNKYQKGDIEGADNPINQNDPPPLEPCSSNAPPQISIPSSIPSQNKADVQPQTKPQPALAPLSSASSPASTPLLPTTRLLIPAAQSTKRKKSPDTKSKAEAPAKKRNLQTVTVVKPPIPVPVPIPKPEKNTCDDDDELSSVIKVEPLDIRDIDEEQPWEPPKLVIDMRAEGSKGAVNAANFNTVKPSILKIRSAAELVTPRVDDPLKENEPKTEPLDRVPKEWRGGKRVTRIPRPPNAFMIFANEWRRKLAVENPSDSNKDISVRLGIKWKNLSTEKKALYYSASRIADEEHKRKYPNYYYSPKEARLRKSQQQSLRRKFAVERFNNAAAVSAESGKPLTPDPLRFVKVFMKDPSTRGVFVAVEGAKTTAAATSSAVSDSTEANLEEEFLKMVEEGDVEAEIEEDISGELDGLADPIEGDESDTDTKPVMTGSLRLLQEQADAQTRDEADDSDRAADDTDTTEVPKSVEE